MVMHSLASMRELLQRKDLMHPSYPPLKQGGCEGVHQVNTKPSKLMPEVADKIRRIKERKAEDQIDVIIAVHPEYPVEAVGDLLIGTGADCGGIRSTDHYISSTLTVYQLSRLEKAESVARIWLNRKTHAMLDKSIDTIKARPVWVTFGAQGERINWAILDTGIDKSHPAFKDFGPGDKKIVEQFDFSTEGKKGDGHGHGTHVAGIVAANGERYKGVAPMAALWDFKVLDSQGSGHEMWAIEAMAEIRKINDKSGTIVIHGANLSLGYEFDIRNYACGHSPICQEANRLVNSGVVVCAAASNDGYKHLMTQDEFGRTEIFSTYLALGITDPGNASQVITVGSTHKHYPHRYGVSYFSSRGPTGDGRLKPDLVAPGERIISCRAKGTSMGKPVDDHYTEASGTSMATPHVSGAIALLLSVKRELIGQPQKVKELLLANCTDLGREKYFQGHGLLDIFRTVQAI